MSQFQANINKAPEARAFTERVANLPSTPGVSLDSVLAPSIQEESELRRLFAQDRQNTRLWNPYVGLVNLFDAPAGVRTTRARVIKDEQDLAAKYLFPIPAEKRRVEGTPSVANSLEDFQKTWTLFTEGALTQLTDWNNVVAAGGSVLACLLPMSEKDAESKRNMRKYFHSAAYPTSDVDLFLWGLNAEQAEIKINQIYEAVRDSIPWDVTCVRTKHAVSIHSQYPYRSIQIVLRLYHSPAEILAGFDIDAPCVAYDGSRVLANPRAIIALMRQANTVDITRRSPSYEIRLSKYASRGFEVYIPDMRRADVDPTIFERSINRITGLARLLVLEKLSDPQARTSYLESRRNLRSRANTNNRSQYRQTMRKRKGDLKAEEEVAGLAFNDYDVTSLHIPYGPGWTAKRIDKLIYQTDLGINSTFNPKNKDRRLHRHPAFFGTMKECMEDLCEYCPEAKTDEEKALQKEEDKTYVRGRISFIEEDPGRQSMTGSFNPIDIGEWNELAYLGPTEKFFAAIVAYDRAAVQVMIASEAVDINRRDHVGRTALHVAILSGATDICIDLINAGAMMMARLVDGRNSLHLAAQMDLPTVVEKLLERSVQNEARAKEAEEAALAAEKTNKESDDEQKDDEESDEERPSSEDDWSSDEDDSKKPTSKKDEKPKDQEQPTADADIPDDNIDVPDILDVNALDWDFAFSPLMYAILSGSQRGVQLFLGAGADPKLPTKANAYDARAFHPLTLTSLTQDEERASAVIDLLLHAGATSSQANEQLFSIFHSIVCSGKTSIVEKILHADPNSSAAINVPAFDPRGKVIYPIVSAIAKGFYSIAALLLGYGAKVSISPEDLQKAKNMMPRRNVPNYYGNNNNKPLHELDYLSEVHLPIETSLANHSYMTRALINLGAQISVPISRSFQEGRYDPKARKSVLEWLTDQVRLLKEEIEKPAEKQSSGFTIPENPNTFADHRRVILGKIESFRKAKVVPTVTPNKLDAERALSFFEEMKSMLQNAGAKLYGDIYPENEITAESSRHLRSFGRNDAVKAPTRTQYTFLSAFRWQGEPVLPHLLDQYDELFEACWAGNNSRIEELCLPRKGTKPEKPPIQITVYSQTVFDGLTLVTHREGIYTPLSVAVLARKWDTVRLIMAIATAQYKPKEEITETRFSTRNIDLNDPGADSDEDAEDSDEGDMDVDDSSNEIGSFTDLASRTSAIQCDVSPRVLLDYHVSPRMSRSEDKEIFSGSVLQQACWDGDLEAFVIICDVLKLLPQPEAPDINCLREAIGSDSTEIVDEIIRRTAVGIDLGQLVEPDDEHESSGSKKSKFYLGLTVHGKKRKDLARHGDTTARNNQQKSELPLLWTAIQLNSKKIVEYLSGPRPLAAYRYYAMTQSDERAEQLRRLTDLEERLPKLLGVFPNVRQETPLTAVILGTAGDNRLSWTKSLFSLYPAQKKAFLHSAIRFYGLTPLLLALTQHVNPEYIDFLIANGSNVEDTDKRGFNIYHLVCLKGSVNLLEHFLKKLSKDITSRLLVQTSRAAGNTPLMIAVKRGHPLIVEKLLQSNIPAVKESLLIRDLKGSMPLHVAAKSGFADIASLITTAAGAEALYSENGVGETPIETACIQWLLFATRQGFQGDIGNFTTLTTHGTVKNPGPPNAERLTTELKLLDDVRGHLSRDGKLTTNVKLKEVLDDFISYMAQKRDEAPASSVGSSTANASVDRLKTYKVISSFVFASPGHRRLVHLVDVQRSVQTSLEKAVTPQTTDMYNDYYNNARRAARQFEKAEEIPGEASAEEEQDQEQWRGVLSWSMTLRYDNDPE